MKHLNFFFYFILVVFLSACSSGSEDIPNPSPIPEPTGEYIPKTLGSSAIGYDPLTLFTDQTCSALKTGITDEDIKACKSDFHKNIALYLKTGKYPSEFKKCFHQIKQIRDFLCKYHQDNHQPCKRGHGCLLVSA